MKDQQELTFIQQKAKKIKKIGFVKYAVPTIMLPSAAIWFTSAVAVVPGSDT
jgi:hypothetical protein